MSFLEKEVLVLDGSKFDRLCLGTSVCILDCALWVSLDVGVTRWGYIPSLHMCLFHIVATSNPRRFRHGVLLMSSLEQKSICPRPFNV